jgi:DinB superfamily
MRQPSSDRLWVLLSHKLGDYLSESEEDELSFLMADPREISQILPAFECGTESVLCDHEVTIFHTRHLSCKSLFISVMKKIAGDLEKALTDFLCSDLLSKDWNYKAGPDKWTKKEIIGHLIDSAQINLQRFVRSTYTENIKVTYDQVAWVEAQRYGHADIEELLELWRLLNRQIVRVLENYPAERLQVQCDTGKNTSSFHSVEYLARDYVNHLHHHLNAIELR